MPEDPSPAAVVSELARAQHGLVSLHQLRVQDISRRTLRTMLGQGWLERAAPGVFRLSGAPRTIESQLTLGLLVLGPKAVVSHEAAARLHGFDRCRANAVEFTVPRAQRHRGHGFLVHSTRDMPAIDRVTVEGFPCTSATRTIIDLAAAGVAVIRLEAAIDSAVRSGASAPSVLARRLEELRGPGRAGVRVLDRLLPDSGGHTRLERRFLALMRQAGLPRPATQVVHRHGARTFARVDFLFDAEGVVVEVSGRKGHASDAERARDAQRRNELQDAGRRVIEYTAQQVFDDPGYVIDTMTARFRSRSGPDVRPRR